MKNQTPKHPTKNTLVHASWKHGEWGPAQWTGRRWLRGEGASRDFVPAPAPLAWRFELGETPTIGEEHAEINKVEAMRSLTGLIREEISLLEAIRDGKELDLPARRVPVRTLLIGKLVLASKRWSDIGITEDTVTVRYFETVTGGVMLLSCLGWCKESAKPVVTFAKDFFELGPMEALWLLHWDRSDGSNVFVRIPHPHPQPDVSMVALGSKNQKDPFPEAAVCGLLGIHSLAEIDDIPPMDEPDRSPQGLDLRRMMLEEDLLQAEQQVSTIRKSLDAIYQEVELQPVAGRGTTTWRP